jgi:hypothetical protein
MNCHDVPFLFHPHVLSPLSSIRVSTMDISFICDSSCLPWVLGVKNVIIGHPQNNPSPQQLLRL